MGSIPPGSRRSSSNHECWRRNPHAHLVRIRARAARVLLFDVRALGAAQQIRVACQAPLRHVRALLGVASLDAGLVGGDPTILRARDHTVRGSAVAISILDQILRLALGLVGPMGDAASPPTARLGRRDTYAHLKRIRAQLLHVPLCGGSALRAAHQARVARQALGRCIGALLGVAGLNAGLVGGDPTILRAGDHAVRGGAVAISDLEQILRLALGLVGPMGDAASPPAARLGRLDAYTHLVRIRARAGSVLLCGG
mmetsp:Transcript_87184/g.199040  ORF Transcript_87184/g.199040 Transcript_87184/m.199040 type:complete len:256 (+) Transcript_87184:127-894(+)